MLNVKYVKNKKINTYKSLTTALNEDVLHNDDDLIDNILTFNSNILSQIHSLNFMSLTFFFLTPSMNLRLIVVEGLWLWK